MESRYKLISFYIVFFISIILAVTLCSIDFSKKNEEQPTPARKIQTYTQTKTHTNWVTTTIVK